LTVSVVKTGKRKYNFYVAEMSPVMREFVQSTANRHAVKYLANLLYIAELFGPDGLLIDSDEEIPELRMLVDLLCEFEELRS
jgi:hypothetical protein